MSDIGILDGIDVPELDERSLLALEFDDDEFDDDDDEFIVDDEFDDDDDEFDDDDDEFDDDDDEFIGALLNPVGTAVKAIGGLFKSKRRPVRKYQPRRYVAKGRRRAVAATSRGGVPLRIPGGYVTPGRLNAALAAVRRDVSRVSSRVARADAASRREDKAIRRALGTAVANESRVRRRQIKKETARLDKKIDDARQMALITSLLGGDGGTNGGDDDDLFLLLALSGGLGGSSDGGINPLMLLALRD